jgi:hypothetical protein
VNRQMAAGSRRLMTVFGWRKLLLQFRFPANDLFTPASSAGTFPAGSGSRPGLNASLPSAL